MGEETTSRNPKEDMAMAHKTPWSMEKRLRFFSQNIHEDIGERMDGHSHGLDMVGQ